MLSADVLKIDEAAEVDKISRRLREIISGDLKRRGLVIAMSGGIDSSVSAALAVQALGPNKVFGLLLPERDSSPDSTRRGELLAKHLGIEYTKHDIAPALEAIGCYQWRDEAYRATLPSYGPGWKAKIIIAGGLDGQFNHFMMVAQSPDGKTQEVTLPLKQYLQVVAATNFKQRLRKTLEYFHADRLNYGVVGTPNRLEYDQGFFVKNGDGSADVKPIAHLYKVQVYALARHLKLPPDICAAIPTTDTYGLPQGQDEFYFALPYAQMDLALWAHNNKVPAAELGKVLGIDALRAERVYTDIESKRRTTRALHLPAVLVQKVPEIVL
jgi:NAD+ synthase